MLALSFEGNMLRLLESQGEKIVRWHSALFNTALIRRGSVADAAGLSQVLAKALETGKFRTREVFAALDGINSLSRIMSIPHGVSVRDSDFILREARRLWSLDTDTSHLYWQPVTGAKQQVFILCVPREPLSALSDAIRGAGLRPLRLDTRPLCLARAVNQRRAVALCAESNSIVIVVLSDGLPMLMQTHWLGETPASPESVSDQASSLLGQALAYYNDTNATDRLSNDTPLLVCGASAQQTLRERLHSDTGYPLLDIAPVFSAAADFPVSQFVVNLGLLMKAL